MRRKVRRSVRRNVKRILNRDGPLSRYCFSPERFGGGGRLSKPERK